MKYSTPVIFGLLLNERPPRASASTTPDEVPESVPSQGSTLLACPPHAKTNRMHGRAVQYRFDAGALAGDPESAA